MLDGKGEDLVLKIFTFEENMKQGKSVYAAEDFAKAQNCFEVARSVYPKDFRVTFWLARTLVMQGQYASALDKLQECRSLRPDLEVKLLAEWINIATNQDASNISSINENTDAALTLLSFNKNIRLLEVISFPFLYFFIGALVGLAIDSIFHLTITWRNTVMSMISAFFLAPLFYRRTMLPESLLSGIATRLVIVKNFFHSKYFYWWVLAVSVELALMVAGVYISPSWAVHMVKNQWQGYEWFAIIVDRGIFTPLAFGIVFRGIVFYYIKSYSRFAAYTVSTLLQAILLIPSTNYIVVLSIMAYTFLYEKSGSLSVVSVLNIIEKLIVTTIVVLIVNNGLV
jgi:tetratricopeptide (TPR) repeat protein